MFDKTLEQLYAEHTGKLSDKWAIYINEYDRIFNAYRNKPVRLLEIGIQNGGSLEIWSKYFSNAQKLVGCDINPECSLLSYEDPRISLVVKDANSDEAQTEILKLSSSYDLIIDDGSHLSGDIVKSFARYFPQLEDGGVFVAEDLHCSYWQQFDGGLFDPFSSITFFKRLADIVNHEHWGIEKARADILSGFLSKYDFQVNEEALQHIHSIEFINSMCIIRKNKPEQNQLGTRIISGSTALIMQKGLHGSPFKNIDQTGNKWTARSMPPGEELPLLIKEIDNLNQAIMSYKNSKSWRITKPLRMIWQKAKSVKRALIHCGTVLSNLYELPRIILTVRRKGLSSVRQHLNSLESHEQINQIAQDRGLPTQLISTLVYIAKLLLRLKHRFQNKGILDFLRGQTMESVKLEKRNLHVHVDNKHWIVKLVNSPHVISGWGVNLETCSAVKVRILIGKTIYLPHKKERNDVLQAFASTCELPPDTGFAAVTTLPVGLHRVRIQLEMGNGSWITIYRALFLRIPRMLLRKSRSAKLSYPSWIRLEQKRLKAELPEIKRHISIMLY